MRAKLGDTWTAFRDAFASLRFCLYVSVVCWTTARITYAQTYLLHGKDFRADNVFFVFLAAGIAAAAMALIECARARPSVVVLAACVVLYVNAVVDGLVNPVGGRLCDMTFDYVAVSMPHTEHFLPELKRDLANVRVWRGFSFRSFPSSQNLTASRGVRLEFPYSSRRSIANLFNTQDALQDAMRTSTADWIVTLQPSAKPLADFTTNLARFACANADRDVLWLYGPAVLRYKFTGGVVHPAVAIAWRRSAVPRILRALDLDRNALDLVNKTEVDVQHLVSKGCVSGDLACAAESLVVDRAP